MTQTQPATTNNHTTHPQVHQAAPDNLVLLIINRPQQHQPQPEARIHRPTGTHRRQQHVHQETHTNKLPTIRPTTSTNNNNPPHHPTINQDQQPQHPTFHHPTTFRLTICKALMYHPNQAMSSTNPTNPPPSNHQATQP
jgi:hypothetical protein